MLMDGCPCDIGEEITNVGAILAAEMVEKCQEVGKLSLSGVYIRFLMCFPLSSPLLWTLM